MLTEMGKVQTQFKKIGVALQDGCTQFWATRKAKYPRCFMLYRMLCSIPASSVSVESLFSFMSHADAPRRRSLHPDRLSRIALTNALSAADSAMKAPAPMVSWPERGAPLPASDRIFDRLFEDEAAMQMLHEEEEIVRLVESAQLEGDGHDYDES